MQVKFIFFKHKLNLSKTFCIIFQSENYDSTSSVCSKCTKIINKNKAFVKCNGDCDRRFHPSCLGLYDDSLAYLLKDKYHCKKCLQKSQESPKPCFICKSSQNGKIIECFSCSESYHTSCLSSWPQCSDMNSEVRVIICF